MKLKKSHLSTAVITTGLILFSSFSSMARPEYFYYESGAQYIYGSMGACQAEASSFTCVTFGSYCGRRYASTKDKIRLAKLMWSQGKTVHIKSRSSNKVVCNVRP